jgi:hypothetical protein
LKNDHKRLERSLPALKLSESESKEAEDVETVSVSEPAFEQTAEETETALTVASILPSTPEATSTASETTRTSPVVMRLRAMKYARRQTAEALSAAISAADDRQAAVDTWPQKELAREDDDT